MLVQTNKTVTNIHKVVTTCTYNKVCFLLLYLDTIKMQYVLFNGTQHTRPIKIMPYRVPKLKITTCAPNASGSCFTFKNYILIAYVCLTLSIIFIRS